MGQTKHECIRGQGGGGVAYAEGSITTASDDMVPINHGLGVVPRVFICWLDKSPNEFPLGKNSFGATIVVNLHGGVMDFPQRITTSIKRGDGLKVWCVGYADTATPTNLSIAQPISSAHGLLDNSSGNVYNSEIVALARTGSKQVFVAGYVYRWLAIA